MNSVVKMMNSVVKMMDFVVKMMNFARERAVRVDAISLGFVYIHAGD